MQETLSATMLQLMLKENEYLSTEEEILEYLGELLYFENEAILCVYWKALIFLWLYSD